jgi:hypothetical protein
LPHVELVGEPAEQLRFALVNEREGRPATAEAITPFDCSGENLIVAASKWNLSAIS